MATGSYPAGIGPAGSDPVAVLSRRSAAGAPDAERYDGMRRDFTLHADGQIEGSTTVEQGVLLSLCVRRGQIAHAPKIGNDLRGVRPSTREREASEIRTAIRQSTPLDRMLEDREVEILSIAHDFGGGRLSFHVEWRDLTTNTTRTTNG
jgi:hypothetical protein